MSNQLQMISPIQEEQEQGMDVDEAVEIQPEEPEIRSGKKNVKYLEGNLESKRSRNPRV